LDREKEYQKEYREKNNEKIRRKQKTWRDNNREQIKHQYHKNRDKINEYVRNKRLVDPLYKLKGNVRTIVRQSLTRNGYTKRSKTHNIIGCPFDELKEYIESKFEPWMSWDNHGLYNGELNYGWDIDHIMPLSTAITKEDIIKLNHYTNLQPLCSKTNRDIKGSLC
tara:strand:+ start:2296 stop:2793 length:498 start_codon:yes stop_codon:yes gene_type:complete